MAFTMTLSGARMMSSTVRGSGRGVLIGAYGHAPHELDSCGVERSGTLNVQTPGAPVYPRGCAKQCRSRERD